MYMYNVYVYGTIHDSNMTEKSHTHISFSTMVQAEQRIYVLQIW